MIVCDLDGQVVAGTPGCERAPSSDTAAHAYVYRHLPDVGGVVGRRAPAQARRAAPRAPAPRPPRGGRPPPPPPAPPPPAPPPRGGGGGPPPPPPPPPVGGVWT